jgi:hypothetical protein
MDIKLNEQGSSAMKPSDDVEVEETGSASGITNRYSVVNEDDHIPRPSISPGPIFTDTGFCVTDAGQSQVVYIQRDLAQCSEVFKEMLNGCDDGKPVSDEYPAIT